MTALLVLVLFADARDLVAAGNSHLLKKEYDLAEKKYLDAQVDAPDSPIIDFNLGNSFLGREDYAKARDYFQKALQTRDPVLEATIKYNIGHTYFGEAKTGLEDLSDPEKISRTVELLQQAIRRWRDVLKLDADHKDATHNIAVATAVLKDYLDRVKRHQEELQKKKEEEKGKDLAQVLEDLKKRQEEEKARTDRIGAAIDGRAPLAALNARYGDVAAMLEGQPFDDTARAAALSALRALLADPAVVEGAASLQEAEKALAAPAADAAAGEAAKANASAHIAAATNAIGANIDAATAKAAEEHATGKKNQTQLLAETQGVVAGLQAQISGETPQATTPPQPGQGAPQGPPLPPEQTKLLEDVRNLVAQATEFQGKAIATQEAGPEKREALTDTAAAQQGAADKLGEALELLKKNQKEEPKQDQQQQDQQKQDQQKQDQQKNDKEKQDQEKQKSLSRQEAEDLLRQMQEKERQKKQEKEKMLQQAYGRRKADKDW